MGSSGPKRPCTQPPPPYAITLKADRTDIKGDGTDLAFVTAKVIDKNGNIIPNASNRLQFSITGPGEIIATDNGDPTDMTAFSSLSRKAFNGLARGNNAKN